MTGVPLIPHYAWRSPEPFRYGIAAYDRIYRFPFTVKDPTYGRIEWHIEPLRGPKRKGRYPIAGLLVWASQTLDHAYHGKLYAIEGLATESIFNTSVALSSFIQHLWRVSYCETHGNLILSSYGEGITHGAETGVLEINVSSSVGIRARYL